MGSNVVPLRQRTQRPESEPKRLAPHPLPERLSLAQIERLHRLAAKWHFTFDEVRFAVISVRAWAEGRGKAADRADWVAVILNSLRLGWGLRGYPAWLKRRGMTHRGARITAERIELLLEKLRAKGYE